MAQDYSKYVEHPRYGRAPRYTGVDPDPDSPDVHLHWNTGLITPRQRAIMEKLLGWSPPRSSDAPRWIPQTAVEANLRRQSPATVPVTHYYDIDTVCCDCGGRFIFFADEQRHWYEELGFPLEANCVRCPPCRKDAQLIARKRRRYEELFHRADRSVDESIDMAECCLTLIEEAVFTSRQTERVRMLLNEVPEDRRTQSEYAGLRARLDAVENRNG